MDSAKPEKVKEEVRIAAPVLMDPKKFSGKVYGIVYNPHPIGFANYALATMHLKKGVVEKIELVELKEGQTDRSEYLGAQEVLARMDMMNGRLLEEMRRSYPAGYRHV